MPQSFLTRYIDDFLQFTNVGLCVGRQISEGLHSDYAGLPPRQGYVLHLDLSELGLLGWVGRKGEGGGREGEGEGGGREGKRKGGKRGRMKGERGKAERREGEGEGEGEGGKGEGGKESISSHGRLGKPRCYLPGNDSRFFPSSL